MNEVIITEKEYKLMMDEIFFRSLRTIEDKIFSIRMLSKMGDIKGKNLGVVDSLIKEASSLSSSIRYYFEYEGEKENGTQLLFSVNSGGLPTFQKVFHFNLGEKIKLDQKSKRTELLGKEIELMFI